MKKLLALTLVGLMSLATFAGCSSESTTTTEATTTETTTTEATDTTTEDTSLQYVLDKGEFILGLDDTFPPMGFRDEDNEIVGFDIDLAEAVCAELGVTLVKQPVDWNSKEMELDTYNIDCIWNGMSITEERQEAMNMSDPYLANEMVFIVRNGEGIESAADLAGKSLAVQSGSSAQDALDDATDIKDSLGEIVEYESNLTALLDLETKGVDVVLMDSVVGYYQVATSGKDFVILDDALAPEYYGIGFRKADIALGDAVADALLSLKEDGTVAAIAEKWFGEDVTLIGE